MTCTINGTRYQRRLGKGITRSVALELAQVQRGAILKGELGIGKKAKDLPFDEARKKFEAWATANKKPGTVRHYQECLRSLAESFGSTPLSKLSAFTVEQHKQRRIHDGALVCVNRELAVLKSLFNRCKEWKLFEGENPVTSVKMRKEPRKRLRFLEPEEEDRLLAECAEPLRTLILVGTNCGLRLRSEALTLRWADVDVARRTLTVAAAYAKNGMSRKVLLNSVILAALTRLPQISDFVFAKPTGKPYHAIRGFRAACQRAGLTGVTPHTAYVAAYVRHAIGGERRGSSDGPGTGRMGNPLAHPTLRARLPWPEGGRRGGAREKFYYAIYYTGNKPDRTNGISA